MPKYTSENLKFPSGRSVKRLKQDAKVLVKHNKIPLHKALNDIAITNGMTCGWNQAIHTLQNKQSLTLEENSSSVKSPLALELGITDSELSFLSWEIDTNENSDGLIYNYIITFDKENPLEILDKISGLSNDNTMRVSVNAFDEEPDPSNEEPSGTVKTDMDPHRKLLVLGVNELVSHNLLSLDWDGKSQVNTDHIETNIANNNSIVSWSDAGFGEVRISVWWKYNHNYHPQANLSGNSKENFLSPSPLSKRQHYPKFVGVVCSAWIERDSGKYIQGKGGNHIFEKYTRKGELYLLQNIPNPEPIGYSAEGKFQM